MLLLMLVSQWYSIFSIMSMFYLPQLFEILFALSEAVSSLGRAHNSSRGSVKHDFDDAMYTVKGNFMQYCPVKQLNLESCKTNVWGEVKINEARRD